MPDQNDPRKISYKNPSPGWSAAGVEPSPEFKAGGYVAGYKPPAGFFNWFWTLVSACIGELQEDLQGYAEANEADKTAMAQQISKKLEASLFSAGGIRDMLNSVSGLNADMVDGKHASDLATAGHTHAAATTSAAGFLSAAGKVAYDGHVASTSNPHEVTAAQVGAANSAELTSHTGNKSNPHGVTAAQAGALASSARGAANGVASLDSSTKVPAGQLPIATDAALGGVMLMDSVTASNTKTYAATPNSVRLAYNLANTANTTAGAANTRANASLPMTGGNMSTDANIRMQGRGSVYLGNDSVRLTSNDGVSMQVYTDFLAVWRRTASVLGTIYAGAVYVGPSGNNERFTTTNVGCIGAVVSSRFEVWNAALSGHAPISASNVSGSSARRYKKNIKDLAGGAVEALLQMRPVEFLYREDCGRGKQYGLIAEEVGDLDGTYLYYNADGAAEGVNYNLLTAPLIKLCQMQQARLDEQGARLERLEQRLAALEVGSGQGSESE